jgi:hypothetical protein
MMWRRKNPNACPPLRQHRLRHRRYQTHRPRCGSLLDSYFVLTSVDQTLIDVNLRPCPFGSHGVADPSRRHVLSPLSLAPALALALRSLLMMLLLDIRIPLELLLPPRSICVTRPRDISCIVARPIQISASTCAELHHEPELGYYTQ